MEVDRNAYDLKIAIIQSKADVRCLQEELKAKETELRVSHQVKDAEVRAARSEEAQKAAEERAENIKRKAEKDTKIMQLEMQLAQYMDRAAADGSRGLKRRAAGGVPSVPVDGDSWSSADDAPPAPAAGGVGGYYGNDVLGMKLPQVTSWRKRWWLIAYEAEHCLDVKRMEMVEPGLQVRASVLMGDRWLTLFRVASKRKVLPVASMVLRFGLKGKVWIEAVQGWSGCEGFDVDAVEEAKEIHKHMAPKLWDSPDKTTKQFPFVLISKGAAASP